MALLRDRPPLEATLSALDDDVNRALLRELTEPMTVREAAEAASIPLSTAYRKFDRLSETPLVSVTIEFDPNGHHRSRYRAAFGEVAIKLDEGGFELDISALEAEFGPNT